MNTRLRMTRLLRSAALAGAFLTTACSLKVASPQPSPWAATYPDTTPVTGGRVVRFAASYGLNGPSPALVWRQQTSGAVSGQMLVWYRAFEPADAGRRPAADSAAEWKKMQSAMTSERARMDSIYGCKAWVRGYQDGPAWVCRVPEADGHRQLGPRAHERRLADGRPRQGGPGRRPALRSRFSPCRSRSSAAPAQHHTGADRRRDRLHGRRFLVDCRSRLSRHQDHHRAAQLRLPASRGRGSDLRRGGLEDAARIHRGSEVTARTSPRSTWWRGGQG